MEEKIPIQLEGREEMAILQVEAAAASEEMEGIQHQMDILPQEAEVGDQARHLERGMEEMEEAILVPLELEEEGEEQTLTGVMARAVIPFHHGPRELGALEMAGMENHQELEGQDHHQHLEALPEQEVVVAEEVALSDQPLG